jgi:hypothetical protein
VGYIDITEGSRAMLGCLVWYMDVTEGSKALLGCPVGYIDFTEGSMAIGHAGVPGEVHGRHRGVQGNAGLPGV